MSSVKFPVIRVDQRIGAFYVGVMRARDLLTICQFDYRRMEYSNGYLDFLGIQRPLSGRRVKEIASYVNTLESCFPTSIVISIDERCASIEESAVTGVSTISIHEFNDSAATDMSIPLDQVASIIDGQHRLKGLEVSGQLDFELTVSIFIGIDDATEASIFSIVNLAQTKVNASLVYDLFSLAKNRSPEKTCHEIVVNLDRLPDSPFHNKIKRLGVATDGRFGETLSQATVVRGILPYITNDPVGDRDRGKRFAFWEPISNKDMRRRIFYSFFQQNKDVEILRILIHYFAAIRDRWPNAWHSDQPGIMINKTNGYIGFIRFLRPAFISIVSEPRVVSKGEFMEIFSRINIKDDDFNSNNFLPGTAGSSQLFRSLVEKSSLDGQISLQFGG